MDIEIFLDCSEVPQDKLVTAQNKFKEWYAEGAEVRCNKFPFSSLRILPQPDRFLIDLGYADPITALRNLHARVRHLGVKVFFHFS